MRRRLEFVKDILAQPAWVLVTIGWGVLSNLPTVISIFEFLTKQDFTQYKDYLIESRFFHFLSLYWIPLLIVIYLLAIAENLYKIALARLGDTINANLNIELFPRHKEGYASVNIFNNEYEDLIEPELSYLELYLIEDGKLIPKLDEINGGASNISWWLGGQKEKVIRGGKKAVFNLAKHDVYNFNFLFDDGSKSQAKVGIYKTIIAIDGKIGKDKKKIESVRKDCFIEFFVKDKKYYIDIRETEKSALEIEPSQLASSYVATTTAIG